MSLLKNCQKITKTLLAFTVLTCTFTIAAEQADRKRFQLTHNKAVIKVDGRMDEAVWKTATKMELKYEKSPGDGTPSPVKTEVYFYENGSSFNVAFIAYDPNPEKIRASLRDRDNLWADDNVAIIIDTFNDERSGYEFFVNPLGAQADVRMDDTDGWDEDSSWDAIWDSAGQITDFGYVVEMSIPFSALRFPDSDEKLVWNIAGWRNYPRDVKIQMATNKFDRDIKCNLCQFHQLVGFEEIKSGKNFQLTPTLTLSRADEKPDVPGKWQDGDIEIEPGLDIRWGLTQDIVLNATLNPDFSQVEADAGQLDVNNTYSLFYPEKRPFFLDGASYFDTTNFNFVHTRNIADPDTGLKLTGKTNEHSYGLMVADDSNTSFLMPGNQGSDIATLDEKSNVAIARYKIDVGERNNVGVLMTHRQSDNYHNTLASFDGTYWLGQNDSIQYQVAQSDTKNTADVMAEFDVSEEQRGTALKVNYARSTRDYRLNAGYTNISEDFRADLGFQSRSNIERVVLGGRRIYYGDSDNTLTQWGYFGDWDKTYDQDGNVLEEEYEIHGNMQGQKQFYTNFGLVHRERLYEEKYFKETQFKTFVEMRPVANTLIGTFFKFGTQIDFANAQLGDVVYIEAFTEWDVNRHINASINYNYSHLDVDDGRLFTAHQSDIRLSYQFSMRSKLKLVLQYTDIARDVDLYTEEDADDLPDAKSRFFSTQLIYSYKINPQTLFFLGYSDSGFQNDGLAELTRDERSVFTKFSYAWQM
ncbi:carbohydrate binding family 9 domain-containing protein [Colwellia piezophila]|uniref:carbohydrate binding family 9 domain-containing protein n=1 Tax=Colwellia piezophila TaxID=211668 RepID=UPI00036AA27E|nr:carbohydrate binding family 9 domain-containing protein [Colwellia piezophila]